MNTTSKIHAIVNDGAMWIITIFTLSLTTWMVVMEFVSAILGE